MQDPLTKGKLTNGILLHDFIRFIGKIRERSGMSSCLYDGLESCQSQNFVTLYCFIGNGFCSMIPWRRIKEKGVPTVCRKTWKKYHSKFTRANEEQKLHESQFVMQAEMLQNLHLQVTNMKEKAGAMINSSTTFWNAVLALAAGNIAMKILSGLRVRVQFQKLPSGGFLEEKHCCIPSPTPNKQQQEIGKNTIIDKR
uniref:Uncharacterized protein n=1 Tax=Romanomermis culicivorax TaxID=13658 RepID=A0A915J536_ROMCU